MGGESRVLEEAKSEAPAAFAATAAVMDLSGGLETVERASASESLRAAAVRHPSASLEIMRRAKGGGA